MKIKEVEEKFAEELTDPLKEALGKVHYVFPKHYQIQVSLWDASGRKKRSTAAASNWSPESGRIEIRFEPASQEQRKVSPEISRTAENALNAEPRRSSASASEGHNDLHPAEADLLKALDRAESKPGWSFVPLKKFRDEILPQEHFTSMRTEVEQRNVLRSAIDKRFVLVGKVPNPKAPQFPVTTVRLNRLMPEVQAALGQSGNPDLDFHPVEISGEPLSATILRDRR